jgi:hypothetical protein
MTKGNAKVESRNAKPRNGRDREATGKSERETRNRKTREKEESERQKTSCLLLSRRALQTIELSKSTKND